MRVEFQLTLSDWREARSTDVRKNFAIGSVIAGATAAALVVLGRPEMIAQTLVPMILMAGSYGWYTQFALDEQTRVVEVDAAGITLSGHRMAWSEIHRWTQTRNLIVLYTDRVTMQPFPKRAFPGESLGDFLALLEMNVGDEGRWRR